MLWPCIRASANKFSGMSSSELKSSYLTNSPHIPQTRQLISAVGQGGALNYSLPPSGTYIDWAKAGYSTAIKDQGACGECSLRVPTTVFQCVHMHGLSG